MKPLSPRARRVALQWLIGAGVFVVLVAVLLYVRRDDLLRTALDPQQPFQTWKPPPAPDYTKPAAWALIPNDPARWSAGDPPADVFFIHPTTYNGGRDWNAAIDQPGAVRQLARVMLPNYAGPFQRVGRVFAPRYRQASLYAGLTNRDDAREARRFAYGDVRNAFLQFLRYSRDRPIVLAGVEQGGQLAARLADEMIATDPSVIRRLAAVYIIEAVVPADHYGQGAALPACADRAQARCVMAWISARPGDTGEVKRITSRAFVWTSAGQLTPLGDRAPLCVNPLLGGVGDSLADAKLNLGAASASGLEWGTRPGFLPHQVSAQCDGGVLRVPTPGSPSLALAGAWADRLKAPPYNLFYADLEADAKGRVASLLGRTDFPTSAASIDGAEVVRSEPVHRVD